ncbi:hypothetical protein [Terrarubrum flagellatum]|uniref:hypothetical protein n=1 Tax=Terrirubrum flagellatum TaxID=2895980 RepID=UPI003144F1D9
MFPSPRILAGRRDDDAASTRGQAQPLVHRLHESPLFSLDGLAELIEHYPRQHCELTDASPISANEVREGDIGAASGRAVIEAIEAGSLRLRLRNTQIVDLSYARLLRGAFGELSDHLSSPRGSGRSMEIVISSPGAKTRYRATPEGQILWQIAGAQRALIYPPAPPFVSGDDREAIALAEHGSDMAYQPWYDDHAQALNLAPGQLLHWPPYAPYRVDNDNRLNIAVMMSYATDEMRRSRIVEAANGALRKRFGMIPRSRATTGLAFWGKAAMQRVLANLRFAQRSDAPKRGVDFTLDSGAHRD